MKIKFQFFLFLIVSYISFAQDNCNTAFPITTAGTFTISSINGTQLPTTTCTFTNTNVTATEWYTYTPTQNYTVTVSSDLAENICKDTRLRIYRGSCASLTCVIADDDSGDIACNSGNNNSNLTKATFNTIAGTTYYIVWDNRYSSAGFNFQLTEAPIVVPPTTPISYTSQTISTINSTFNICVVDMNGDSKDDIVGVSANNLKVHFQGTGENFSITNFPITGISDMPVWSLAAGDYNKDGFNDIVLGSGDGLTFWKSNNTGTSYTNVNPSDYIFCQRTNFIDINNDGNLDAFSCHDLAPNVYYLNDGFGNMTYYQSGVNGGYMLGVTPTGGNYASMWSDFDNDGDRDLFISKCSGPPCELHRNDGNGVFTDISAASGINVTPIQTWSSAISDFENDGDMDIIITASVGSHYFFRNNLDTSTVAYTNITSGSGWDTNTSTNIDNIAYDFDNDGSVDVLGGGNKIMFNQGNNVFSPVSYTAISVGAVGDLNNDGFLDILNGNTIRYAVPNGNNWLKLSFKGIQSNSNGIGARVEIYGSWGKQIRDVRSGEGYKYMSSLNVHFGIGSATSIDKVIVRWPSGLVDTFFNVTPNQILSVIEGATLSTNVFENSVFTMYPIPVKNNINIAISTANPVEFKFAEIYDLNGRRVQISEVINQNITVDELAAGTYILKLMDTNNKYYSQKFIKE
jgi:ASPIC and UnbV/FG-GAP-like repeat/Secretion system C-terminal sorting domain